MADKRVALNEVELDSVVGGALVWNGGVVYPKDNPDAKYSFKDYSECRAHIKKYWPGGVQNEDTLKMLEDAGLVTKL